MRTTVFTAGLSVLALLAGVAEGQTSITTYDVQHTFNWMPPPGVIIVPTVRIGTFQHVWVKDRAGPYNAWAVVPLAQSPNFDGLGRDTPFGIGANNIPENGGPQVPCNFATFPVSTTGLHAVNCLQIVSPNSNTFANACYDIDIFSFGAGTPVQGSIRSMGNARATGPGARAYAFSSAGISITDGSASGSVHWAPFFDSVSGEAFNQSVRHDPIAVTVTDASGVSASSVILSIDFISDSAGTMSWANDTFQTDARNAEFSAQIIGPVARSPGVLRFRIQNGVVVSSNSSGSLSFPVPPAGTAVPFAFPLPNAMLIDYDATVLLPGPIANTSLDFFGGADAPVVAPPCGSADFNGDGDIGTDADIEAFFACLAGICCETCGTADFNGDGDIGTDADIEAFFRVLAGGAC